MNGMASAGNTALGDNIVCLWTNPQPYVNRSFEVSIDLSMYEAVLITGEYYNYGRNYAIALVGSSGEMEDTYHGSNYSTAISRAFSVSKTGVSFAYPKQNSSYVYDSTVIYGTLIPGKIYGIKNNVLAVPSNSGTNSF